MILEKKNKLKLNFILFLII